MGKGRVTIPTDLDVVPQTLEMIEEWGADAIRDCDGTEFPQKLKDTGAKIYATYYTTRKDNAWAKAHPEEIQQMYIMTSFHTAVADTLEIHLMDHLYPDMLAVNTRDDIRRWWEVMDRTTGEPVPTDQWSYEEETGNVVILSAKRFHEYTVSFLAYIMWDPVHMYNAVVNDWKDVEPQITFDVRQPKTRAHSLERLRRFLDTHEYVDVVRFTTFFHQFTLIFDELAREKYVDWFGYSASVSPYILEQFEKEVGYPFRPEYIIDQGYMNNTYRIPSKEFKDFQAFQRREVAKLAKEMVEIGKSAGRKMTAVITNMDEPLGMAVGNILEVKEAIDTLKGNGPDDFVELIETLASHMLILGGAAKDFDEGLMRVRESIQSGKALDKFKQFVAAQGGDTKYIDHPELFEQADIIEEIRSEQDGFVGSIDAQEMGICSLILGGGRETKESVIDPTVGLVFSKKVADPVKKGDVLATIYGNDEEKVKQAVLHFKENYHIIEEKPTKPIMIREVLS